MKQVTVKTKKGERVTLLRVDSRPRNPADAFADDKYEQVAHRLRLMYHNAAKDLKNKQWDWLERHQKRVEKYRAQVEAGLITEDDFKAWMRGQIFQQREWALKRGQLARAMVDVDKQAMAIINRGRRDVFADNANFMGFRIDQQTGGAAASFGLYDENALDRLIREKPRLLPMPEIDEEKDYAWYNDVINDAVTQGILQGEMLDQIVQRIAEDTNEKSLYVMRRNARTAYTGAQNAGRMEAMRQARDDLGIQVKKRWLCTLDSHTRDSHALLDGQMADIDEPFESILGPIMYPGDPDAAPKNVYNCRCTLEEVPVTGHQWKMDRRDQETGENVGDMDYKEWLRSKQGEAEQESEIEKRENTNIYGREISIDDKLTGETRETLEKLIDEYDTRLEKVELGHAQGVMAAGSVDMSGATMKISQKAPTVAIHEFAHSLANSSADKYGLTHDGDFWKEIKQIRREYKKDVDKEYNFKRFISSYEHSQTGSGAIDEFFAEAFAQAKAREMGLTLPEKYGEDYTYSQRVLETVDKYFRRGKHGGR